MRMELTIATNYLPTWSTWEGIRELIQNGKDAEAEFNAPLTIDLYNNTLRIENVGCTLPHEALLLGHTSKQGRKDMIGQYGEGLKIGILALVRAGRPVKIRSGSEVWIPTIARSEKFDADVLAFDIATGRKDDNRVRVEIGGVTEVDWAELQTRFLFLAPRENDDQKVFTGYGDLLLGEKNKGKIFVKGIYVQTNPQLKYGYNFSDVEVDRDRKMISGWDIQYRTNKIWAEAAASRPDLFFSFMSLVRDSHDDIKGMDAYAVGYVSQDVLKKVNEDFRTKYGDDAVPVANLSESADIEHLGKRGIVVNSQLACLLAPTVGTFDKVKAACATEIVTRHSYGDLTEDEKRVLDGALTLIRASGVCADPIIDVVDFRSKDLMGQFQGGKSSISRAILADRNETLATLVHELAHQAGKDGDKGHVDTVELYWSKIVAYLRGIIE